MPGARETQVDALYGQGSAAFRAGRYAESAACAERAIALEPDLAALHFLLGSARLELRDFAGADAAFATCLALRPRYPTVLYAQARAAVARARAGLMKARQPALLARDPADRRRVSLVICSIHPERFDAVCANYRALLHDVPHEIIGIHDARSLCEGYNRGIRRASGEILVLSHDDVVMVTPDFAAKLLAHLTSHDLIGVAGTTRLIAGNWIDAGWPHLHGQIGSHISKPGSLMVTAYQIRGATVPHAQALDGAFLAMRREVAERVTFDERTFDGWHLYDLDFVFSAHLAGLRTAVCNDLCLIHNSIGAYAEKWDYYVQRFVAKHRDRLQKGEKAPPAEAFWLEMSSPVEWLLVTEEMIARPVPGPEAATSAPT
ncbi:MAG: glycosyltransferase [Burkholderiales bacterium]